MAGDWFGTLIGNQQFRRAAGDALSDFGYGLATAPTFGDAFGAAAMRGAQMQPYRADQLQKEQQQATEEKQRNLTRDWLEQRGFSDLAQLVDAGQGQLALAEAQKRMQPPEQVKPIEINGQLVNPMNGQVLGDYRDPQSNIPAAPSGYRWDMQTGGLAYIPGGPADPATAASKPPTEAERKAGALATVTKQDAATLFGTETNPGVFDALGGWGDAALQTGVAGVSPLAGFASNDFKVAKDAISNIAQSYLYAMSGATAPPEEVRKLSEMVTPGPFDTPQQKSAKRDRLFAMYQAIEGAQGNAATSVGGDWEVIGVQ